MSYVKTSQGSVINTDESYYMAVLQQRENEKKAREMRSKIDELTSEITEIRNILKQAHNNRVQNG